MFPAHWLALAARLVHVAATLGPVEEETDDAEGVTGHAGRRPHAVYNPRDVVRGDRGEVFIAKGRQEIAVEGTLGFFLGALLEAAFGIVTGEEDGDSVFEFDGGQVLFAENTLREQFPRFRAGVCDGDGWIPADGDPAPVAAIDEDKGPGTTRGYPDAKAGNGLVDVCALAFLKDPQSFDREVGEVHSSLSLGSAEARETVLCRVQR